MCTISVVAHSDGFRMMCNRDERRDRARAWPPRTRYTGGLTSRFPIDPVSGGTWIGINDAGFAVALLNRTSATAAGEPLWSRGVIVPYLLSFASLPGAIAAARHLDVRQFQPFSVLMVQDGHMSVADHLGGGRLAVRTTVWSAPLLLTSSSLGDARVDGPRRRLFDSLVLGSRDHLLAQTRFHRHQWRQRPEISVRMERADARSVSLTIVEVRGSQTRLEYFELRDRGRWPAGVQAA